MKKYLLFLLVIPIILTGCEDKELTEKYEHGLTLIEQKEWERATNTFEELGEFKDSKDKLKEIIYLENTEMLDSNINFLSLYKDDLKKSLDKLETIIDYKDTKKKINNYIEHFKSIIDSERNVNNSEQKDYSLDVFKSYEILSDLAYSDNYKKDIRTYLCDFTKHALKEGFYIYTFTSGLKYYCDDTEELENNKYYKMVSKSWNKIIDKNRFSSNSYFVQFNTENVMLYEDTYISIYGQVPLRYSYWYKIYNNAIYAKENKNDKYKKKFAIKSVDDKNLSLSGIKKPLEAM